VRIGAAILAVSSVAILSGCGGGNSEVVESAYERRDQAYGEYLLAEVEVDRVRLGQSEAKGSGRNVGREWLRRARHDSHLCLEGNAFESCPQREQIEAIVKEMAEALRHA
jgi:hypothetical protein